MIRAMKTHSLLRILLGLALVAGLATPSAAAAASPDAAALRASIEELKANPRGPFERIRWYCKDGSVLPPKAYACREHGGGVQHGEWNATAKALRADGYAVANVFASMDVSPLLGANANLALFDQLLMERFLMRVDDGWIFRGARSYRGALQAEDEEAGAQALVLAMLADPTWLTPPRFARLREAVRLLPLPLGDAASAAKVRAMALELAEKDKPFTPLRAKIHNVPDAGDAAKVRDYASRKAPKGMKPKYESLAAEIDKLYASGGAAETLRKSAKRVSAPALGAMLRDAAKGAGAADPADRFRSICQSLARLRDEIGANGHSPEDRLVLLETSVALEDGAYTVGTELLQGMSKRTRRQRLTLLGDTTSALYGIGFITARHMDGVGDSLQRIQASGLTVDAYRTELRYLARGPEWSGRWLEFNFGETVYSWLALEPKAILFNQDRLRGSPLLFYSGVIDGLNLDANQLAGIEHELFGRKVGSGLRALNPGLTRGQLVAPEKAEGPSGGFGREGIYLLPESTAELPRVNGILTRGEGSSLSHVQLLARNLGIPNVVVGNEHVPTVTKHDGDQVVLAVSPQGVVQLSENSAKWDKVFGEEKAGGELVIKPDLEKLDLAASMIPLTRLRAKDSGRLSGPKGANLGELKHHFGDAVPDGFVITFGVFRMLLEQPIRPGGPKTWDWMRQEYPRLAKLSGAEQEREVAKFLKTLRDWIAKTDPGPGFRQGLKMGLDRLGPDGTFGVFVRSDTNVEDLPGFTGAGLNLTVFNIVGYENVLAAVKDVWASPFEERSFGWRQNNMQQPEYVFPAVVIQKAFPSEKSGVLVTVDVDSGAKGWLTVAVNEGVGGAVEGQAAESLKIDVTTGDARFLAQSTAPKKSQLNPRGGIDKVPTSGTDAVLTPGEIQRLIQFSQIVGETFPSLQDHQGGHLPADVEFGFRNGQLTLLQIRPFVESKSAQKSSYLSQLDARFAELGQARVNLNGVPKESD
jgi:hypothetical protein